MARFVLLLAVVLGAALLQASDGGSEPMPVAYCQTALTTLNDLPADLPGLPGDPTSVLEAILFLFVLVLIGFVAIKRFDARFGNLARGPSTWSRQAHFQVPRLAQLCVLRT